MRSLQNTTEDGDERDNPGLPEDSPGSDLADYGRVHMLDHPETDIAPARRQKYRGMVARLH